jgi:hypothetical protein
MIYDAGFRVSLVGIVVSHKIPMRPWCRLNAMINRCLERKLEPGRTPTHLYNAYVGHLVLLITSVLSYQPIKVTSRPRRVKTVVLLAAVDTVSVVWVVDVISSVTGEVTVTTAVATAPGTVLGEEAHPTRENSE